MTDGAAGPGWFESVPPDDLDAARDAIETGSAELPEDWPAKAVESGFAVDEDDYYDRLHEATTAATRAAAREAGRADDQQLKHAVRAMDDTGRAARAAPSRTEVRLGGRTFLYLFLLGIVCPKGKRRPRSPWSIRFQTNGSSDIRRCKTCSHG